MHRLGEARVCQRSGELPVTPLGEEYSLLPKTTLPCSTSLVHRAEAPREVASSSLTELKPTKAILQDGNLQEHFLRLPLVPRSCSKSWRERTVKQLGDLHNGMATLHGTACRPHRDCQGCCWRPLSQMPVEENMKEKKWLKNTI